MNNKYDFDPSKRKEMQEFLDFIYTITIQNPNENINSSAIYNQLIFRGLSPNEKTENGVGINTRQFFDRWKERFASRRNVSAFCDEKNFEEWFQFVNGNVREGEFIKLYIPINTPHLYEGVNQLFDFIASENIEHESKVGEIARIDNVIVRLRKGDKTSAQKIIDFINSNKYLKTGLNKNNPFIPSIKGVGFMREYGISYTSVISELMESYIRYSIYGNKKPNIDGFKTFVEQNAHDNYVIETFDNAYYGGRGYNISNKDELNNSFDRVTPLNETQKVSVFIDACKETYKRHGINQVIGAIEKIVHGGNYSSISNGKYGYRNILMQNVPSYEIEQIINNGFEELYGDKYSTTPIEGKITSYVYTLFQENLLFSFEEACMATLNKYGTNHLRGAIRNYFMYGKTDNFTRTSSDKKVDYRASIQSIDNHYLIYYLTKYLNLKGYNVTNKNSYEIIDDFVYVLSNSKYMDDIEVVNL